MGQYCFDFMGLGNNTDFISKCLDKVRFYPKGELGQLQQWGGIYNGLAKTDVLHVQTVDLGVDVSLQRPESAFA
eukprot:CAMPEP_0175147022 /NCGR_PEP_ID=MMETSP0087-20121206/15721_1 /TAXON_ID=136419 /ORGANISM="Unknown Unknown, Strain D1" /LENGTH=73 /DNA_ID=CAMNT_0016432085 /DNA_START=431 /DNA_END=652 /DNA_ORIENTATION=+